MTTWILKIALVPLGLLVLAVAPAGAQSPLFDNTNPGGVLNNPPQPTVFTLSAPATITQIVTYHWNNGRGAPPGRISLRSQAGRTFGPFPARGTAGQGGAPNVNWVATPNVSVPAGTYTVVDSDPGTWSHNQQSRNRGFAKVSGKAAGSPPATGFRPCNPDPNAVAAMGPCSGPRGTAITIQVTRALQAPITRVRFYPFDVRLPGATGAQVFASPTGNGTTVGSFYRLSAPQQLCISGGGRWDLQPLDARGQNLGRIGTFAVLNCP